MTTYPLSYFDKTPGTLEQLVLATITQSLANQDYVLAIIRDFTTGSIEWNVTVDAVGSDNPTANLNMSLTFPTMPFDRQSLTDASSFDRRIASVNSLDIDTLSLPQKSSYPLNSYPVELPNYLSIVDAQNTLERRLMALIIHTRNVQNWIERWNRCASHWMLITYLSATNPRRTLGDVELERDNLLLELTDGFSYQPLPVDIFADGYLTPSQINPGNARAEIDTLNNGSIDDPALSQLPVSQTLLVELKQQLENNFANNAAEYAPINIPSESPSLPDC
jgi:hypothetical protein